MYVLGLFCFNVDMESGFIFFCGLVDFIDLVEYCGLKDEFFDIVLWVNFLFSCVLKLLDEILIVFFMVILMLWNLWDLFDDDDDDFLMRLFSELFDFFVFLFVMFLVEEGLNLFKLNILS